MNIENMNLAGVSFIAPPRELHPSLWQTWAGIISSSGYWFTTDTMRFWKSRVVWDSLTGITATKYGFISSELDSYGVRRYTVRTWTKKTGVDTLSEMHQFETLKQARQWLRNAGWK